MDNSKKIPADMHAFMRELIQELLSEDAQVAEDLKKWFKQDWVRIDSQGNIAGPCGTSKDKNNPDRCLPRAKAQSLSKSERKATAAKKKKGKGQFVSNTKKAKVSVETADPQDGKAAPYGSGYKKLDEYIDMDIEMFAKRGDIFSAMYKADKEGKLETFYKKLQDKLSGSAQEAADYFYSFIKDNRDTLTEGENEPTNPQLWSRAKAAAKRKFDVYPSAYANAWASKWYKGKGGNWRKKKSTNEDVQKRDDKWVVLSKSGKLLGTHDTEKQAQAQLTAIHLNKEQVDHKAMNPGILSKDSSLKGEDGKIKISKVRAALAGIKDKNSTKAKALRRFINYHD